MKRTSKGGESPKQESDRQQPAAELADIIQMHKVCWEVLPEQVAVEGDKPLTVGFDLVLYGAHAHGARPLPGCEKCVHIYKDLRKVAEWILPKVRRVSRYEISIYESAIGYSRVRDNRPEVSLTIKILHRSAYDSPVDECEVVCLNEMKEKLSELGAQEKRWRG